MKETLKLLYRRGRLCKQLLAHERAEMRLVRMPWRRRLRLWSWGFGSEADVLYSLTPTTRHQYVSAYEYYLRTPFINGIYNPILNDKVVFFHTMRSLGTPTARIYALVAPDGRLAWLDGRDRRRGVPSLLEEVGELVVKPFDGGRGDNVRFVAAAADGVRINGELCGREALDALLRPGMLVCERIHPAAYATRVFPASNTLRAMTLWDYDLGVPFLTSAIHRFGTRASAPVDNVSSGGLMAPIDVATGRLGRAVGVHAATLVRHVDHPETGARIEGMVVEGWGEVARLLLRTARELPQIPYIGWDVLLADGGPVVIEGNTYPDMTVQVFGPLLADPRVRRFYERHRVVRRRLRRRASGRR